MHPESLNNTIQLIKSLLPEFNELLSDIRQGHGFFNFPTQAIEILSKDGLPLWAVFYENHDRMKPLVMRALIGNENFDEFKQGIEGLSDSEIARFIYKNRHRYKSMTYGLGQPTKLAKLSDI